MGNGFGGVRRQPSEGPLKDRDRELREAKEALDMHDTPRDTREPERGSDEYYRRLEKEREDVRKNAPSRSQ